MVEIEYKQLFSSIARTESGENQNLGIIEERLTHLRKGSALSYEDLEAISDAKLFPFLKYWMWPYRSQIEKKLEATKGWFKDLPKDEERIIQGLDKIFKNIALVSIILRFARPDIYAIYSIPVLQILRIERGRNDVEEYLNYIHEIRVLRSCFGVETTAEVDGIVWAISQQKDKYGSGLKKILAKSLPGNLTAEELIIYLSHDPIRVAKQYMEKRDHMTAGFWAAKAFEMFLHNECRQAGILTGYMSGGQSTMINKLHERARHWQKPMNRALLKDAKDIRNKIIHSDDPINPQDVEDFILLIVRLRSIAVYRCY
jgi:hypothetical protein